MLLSYGENLCPGVYSTVNIYHCKREHEIDLMSDITRAETHRELGFCIQLHVQCSREKLTYSVR
jgi:hypothetical protein